MVDQEKVRTFLKDMLKDVEEQAKADALEGECRIGDIFRRNEDQDMEMRSIDPEKVAEAIENIDKATATKESARRLVNAIMVAAKVAANVYLK